MNPDLPHTSQHVTNCLTQNNDFFCDKCNQSLVNSLIFQQFPQKKHQAEPIKSLQLEHAQERLRQKGMGTRSGAGVHRHGKVAGMRAIRNVDQALSGAAATPPAAASPQAGSAVPCGPCHGQSTGFRVQNARQCSGFSCWLNALCSGTRPSPIICGSRPA